MPGAKTGPWHIWHESPSGTTQPHVTPSDAGHDSSDSRASQLQSSRWAGIKLSPNALRSINAKDPFGDIKLERMLGYGAYGRVFKGKCGVEDVAVKIIEHAVPDEIEPIKFYYR